MASNPAHDTFQGDTAGHFKQDADRTPLAFEKQLTDGRLLILAAGASVYVLVHFIEAYGLWHARPWKKWFAAMGSGIYISFELFAFHKRDPCLSS